MRSSDALKRHRENLGWSASKAAMELGISPQHLSRVENNKQALSPKLLEKVIEKYQLRLEDALALRDDVAPTSGAFRSGVDLSQTTQVRIEIDPMRTPVHYTNAAAISSDKFGIVLDAGQRIASSNKVQIVARIGFSLEHAEEIEQALMSHIKKLKDERRKNRP